MRVILAGQKSFGAAALDMLIEEGHDIAAVWSPLHHDGDVDRLSNKALKGQVWSDFAYRTPTEVRNLEVDLFVAAHSHDFIGKESRAATRLGGIGFHPSLLPRHRGRDAVRWTIHMQDPIAGGSVYWLTDNVDGGPIAAQEWCWVHPRDDPSTLWRRDLFPIGLRLLARVLRELDQGVLVEVPQEEDVATWEPSWERPPLFRPELPQLGHVNGFEVRVTRDALHR